MSFDLFEREEKVIRRGRAQCEAAEFDVEAARAALAGSCSRSTAKSSGKKFLAVDNHEAWLRRTAVNLHRNRWRKLRNFSRIKHRLEQPTDAPGLEEHVVVIEALRAIPEPQRQVLALHYLADLSVEDISATLGVAEGTVKSRLGRGRQSMASALGPEEGGSSDA